MPVRKRLVEFLGWGWIYVAIMIYGIEDLLGRWILRVWWAAFEISKGIKNILIMR